MLRLIFVFSIVIFGIYYATQGAFYTLLFYLWNAYFRPEEWVWRGDLVRPLHLSFCVGVFLVLKTLLSGPKWPFSLGTAMIFLFFGQAVVCTITSEHFDPSWRYLSDFWKVLLISYFIIVLVDDRRKLRLTLLTIALSLGFECAKQGWVGNYRAPGGVNNNIISFLGDNNGVALGTMMLAPLFAALAQTTTKRWEKFTLRFLMIGVILRGIATYSRGGFLAAGSLGIVTFVRSHHKVRALIGVAAVAILVVNIMPQVFWDRMQTITAPAEQRVDSSEGRLHFWDVAVVMANKRPLTGVGLEGFKYSYEAYNTSGEFGGVGRATHSTWFGVLADMGYPGLLLFVGNWVLGVWSCWRVSRAAKDHPEGRELGLYANALMTSFIVFAVAGTFLSEQYSEMFWHFTALSAALSLVARKELAVAVPAVQWRGGRRPVAAAALSS